MLAFFILFTLAIMLGVYGFEFSKHKRTDITKLVLIALVLFSYGIFYDLIRILIFQFGGTIVEYQDQLGYFLEVTFLFFNCSVLLRIALILNRQSGHPFKRENFLRYLFMGIAAIFSLFNIYHFEVTPTDATGYYTYQISPVMTILSFTVYISLFAFMFLRALEFFREIRDKRLKTQVGVCMIFFAFLLVERFSNNALYYLLFSYVSYLIVINLLGLAILAIVGLGLILYNPNFLDNVSTYFCVRGVYLIEKKGGYVLYGYNFQNRLRQEIRSQDEMLLGGFIQAISTGLSFTLNIDGVIQVIQASGEYIYFAHGDYVFGVVFSTDANERIGNKLMSFVEKFEMEYESYLRDWTGKLVKFRSEIVERWLFKCFR
jgi:hypothetical protein